VLPIVDLEELMPELAGVLTLETELNREGVAVRTDGALRVLLDQLLP
jgi:hypothetical protein